jgi:hypothetical protein
MGPIQKPVFAGSGQPGALGRYLHFGVRYR